MDSQPLEQLILVSDGTEAGIERALLDDVRRAVVIFS